MTIEELEKTAFDMYPNSREGRDGYIKGFCEGEREGTIHTILNHPNNGLPKTHGWVARDSVEDAFIGTGLCLHHSKPIRCGGEWSSRTIAMHLPSDMFPEITWKDDPIEVELLIREV